MDDQTILAESESFGNITMCPGGIVHVNLAHLSLKFLPEDFVKLSDLVAKARHNMDTPPRGDGKPRLTVVSADRDAGPSTESDTDSE